jgi:hemolysin III
MTDVMNFNGQCKKEELANAITHGIGAGLAVAGTAVMIVWAFLKSDAVGIVSAFIYGISLISLYTFSTLYHACGTENKKILQKLDHCSIFFLIVGSYAPLCLALLGGKLGWALFALNISCAAVGIAVNIIDLQKWHKLSLVLYLVMGWSCIVVIKPILGAVNPGEAALLVAGGLFYSIGVVFYKNKKYRFMHSIWHLFVIAGSVSHYFFVLFYIILS